MPISYSVSPPFSEIGGLLYDAEGLRSAVDALAGPTAVDGATVISDHFDLLAFGVKIISRRRVPTRRPGSGYRADRGRARSDRRTVPAR